MRTSRAAKGVDECPVHDLLAMLAYVDPDIDADGFRAAARRLFS